MYGWDVVRIHRVVKERRFFRPVRTRGSVFMVHGSRQGFTDIFLNAGTENPSPETSVPMYLASKGIDVWGIDLAWNFVPKETTDFSFMEDWGLEKDIKHTLAAMSIARFFRGLTGQGFGRMNLLGYSYGAGIAYTAAGMETQQPRFFRDIKSIIPVDFGLKINNIKWRQLECNRAPTIRSEYEAGTYHIDNRGAELLGNLAMSEKSDDESPFITLPNTTITNYQAPLVIGLRPRPVTNWHFLAGKFDPKTPAFQPYHTQPQRWFKLYSVLPPYMPKLPGVQLAEARCNQKEVSIDDHLSDISVPILYLGAIGAEGDEGYYTTSLTSSSDITTETIEAETPGKEDYGHADLFVADNAPELVWDKLRDWIIKHDRTRRNLGDRIK